MIPRLKDTAASETTMSFSTPAAGAWSSGAVVGSTGTTAAVAVKAPVLGGDGPDKVRRREDTLQHMERYAREGLRTLLVTSADLELDWFLAWDKRCVRCFVR